MKTTRLANIIIIREIFVISLLKVFGKPRMLGSL